MNIALGLLAGLLGGAGGIAIGLLLTRLLLQLNPRSSGGWEDLIFGILAVIVFYPLGAGLAAGLALRRSSRPGMIWKAVLAAYAAEILVMLLADPLGLNLNTTLLFGLILVLPQGAILLAYWFNRRREPSGG